MKLITPEISWHGKEPVLSVDFCKIGNLMRFASAGADNDVKLWLVSFNKEGNAKTEFLANLSRHNKAVNVVRFAPQDEVLASASDDGVIILWKLNTSQEQCIQQLKDKDDDVENRESWTAHKVLRGHIEDVYDLAWSPDGLQLVSGSVDNSAIVWDAVKGVKLHILKDHKHYVQGVCWDPLGQYIVTNSSDRSCRLYSSQTYRYCYNINRLPGKGNIKLPEGGELKQLKMFHDETLLSFFRRPSFTPDGSLLIVPAGRIDTSTKAMNATFVFTRGSPNKPVLYLPSPKKPTVAVRCCPVLFELKKKDEEMEKENKKEQETSLFKLPYRMVFAVATLNSVLLYDTQHKIPFGYISNIHYSGLSDLTWSNDGNILIISSTDGYCSIVQFQENEFGIPYEKTVKEVLGNPNEFQNINNSSFPIMQLGTPDNSGKVQKKVILTPVQQKMDIDTTLDDGILKKKETPQIDKFAVPMSQIQTVTPTKPPDNKLAPRRIPLSSTSQPGYFAVGPNPSSGQAMTGQTVIPNCVQLVTTSQADQSLASIKSLVNNVQPGNFVTMLQPSHRNGHRSVTGQATKPLLMQVPQGTNNAQTVNAIGNVKPAQANVTGQAAQSQTGQVQLVTMMPNQVPQGNTNVQTLNAISNAKQASQVQPKRVQLVTMMPNQVPQGNTNVQTLNAISNAKQASQAQPKRVQLVTMMPNQVPQGNTNVLTLNAISNAKQASHAQPKRVQLVTMMPNQVPQGNTNIQTVNAVSNAKQAQVNISKQASQAQPKRVQLVTMMPNQVPQGNTNIQTVNAVSNVKPEQVKVTGQAAQPKRVQLGTMIPNQVPQGNTNVQTVNAVSNVKPEQVKVTGQAAQPKRVQFVTVPNGETVNNSKYNGGSQNAQEISSLVGQVSSMPTGATPTPSNPVSMTTAQPNSLGNKSTITAQPNSLGNKSTITAQTTPRRVPLVSVAGNPKQVCGIVVIKEERVVQPVQSRLELSSLSISAKPNDADDTPSPHENKQKTLITTLSPKETIQNPNDTIKENVSRKPIPLEPTVIVID